MEGSSALSNAQVSDATPLGSKHPPAAHCGGIVWRGHVDRPHATCINATSALRTAVAA